MSSKPVSCGFPCRHVRRVPPNPSRGVKSAYILHTRLSVVVPVAPHRRRHGRRAHPRWRKTPARRLYVRVRQRRCSARQRSCGRRHRLFRPDLEGAQRRGDLTRHCVIKRAFLRARPGVAAAASDTALSRRLAGCHGARRRRGARSIPRRLEAIARDDWDQAVTADEKRRLVARFGHVMSDRVGYGTALKRVPGQVFMPGFDDLMPTRPDYAEWLGWRIREALRAGTDASRQRAHFAPHPARRAQRRRLVRGAARRGGPTDREAVRMDRPGPGAHPGRAARGSWRSSSGPETPRCTASRPLSV